MIFFILLSFLNRIDYIYEPLNRTSSRIVQAATASGLAQKFRILLSPKIKIKSLQTDSVWIRILPRPFLPSLSLPFFSSLSWQNDLPKWVSHSQTESVYTVTHLSKRPGNDNLPVNFDGFDFDSGLKKPFSFFYQLHKLEKPTIELKNGHICAKFKLSVGLSLTPIINRCLLNPKKGQNREKTKGLALKRRSKSYVERC